MLSAKPKDEADNNYRDCSIVLRRTTAVFALIIHVNSAFVDRMRGTGARTESFNTFRTN